MLPGKCATLKKFVSGKARSMFRFVSRLSVYVKLSVPPPTGCSVSFCILDHELQVPIRGGSGNEGLIAAKYLVVFGGGDVVPRESCNNGTVWERLLSLAIGVDCFIVAQNCPNIV